MEFGSQSHCTDISHHPTTPQEKLADKNKENKQLGEKISCRSQKGRPKQTCNRELISAIPNIDMKRGPTKKKDIKRGLNLLKASQTSLD